MAIHVDGLYVGVPQTIYLNVAVCTTYYSIIVTSGSTGGTYIMTPAMGPLTFPITFTPGSDTACISIIGGIGVLQLFSINLPRVDSFILRDAVTLVCNEDQYHFGYNGQVKDNEVSGVGNHYSALFWEYDTRLGRRWNVDPVDQINISNYAVNRDNPILLKDSNGDCPLCAVAGAVVGAVIGGAIEMGSQLYHSGSVSNWTAVGGSALQGGITGGVAGLTGGTSLMVTTSASVAANVAGGAVNRAVQGKSTTAGDVLLDAAVGAGGAVAGHFAGKYVEKALDKASTGLKGDIGEAVTKIKYSAKGYVDEGKAVVPTGRTTPGTGQPEVARYDFNFRKIFTDEHITVESKFNSSTNPPKRFNSGFTGNQKRAIPNVTTPGLIVDRTSSTQLGNATKAIVTGSSGQINNH